MSFSKEQLNALFRYAFSLTANKDDAYDLLQSSIEKLLKNKSEHISNSSYIRRIIRNQFIDQCRRKKVIAFETLEEDKLAVLSTHSLESIVINEGYVDFLMGSLTDGERECLFMWAVLGYTAQEIAQETKEPKGTILSRLYRVKKKVVALSEEEVRQKQTGREAQSE